MKTLILNIPDHIELEEKETQNFLASKLYESGKLTLGQAADMLNMSKKEFIEILPNYNVSLINYSEEDLLNDISRI